MNTTTTTERQDANWLSVQARADAAAILCKLNGVIEGVRGIALAGEEPSAEDVVGLCWVGNDLIGELQTVIGLPQPEPDKATPSATGA